MHSSGKSVRPLWLYSGKVRSCGYSSEGVVVRPLGLLLNWPVECTCGLWFIPQKVSSTKCTCFGNVTVICDNTTLLC